MKIVVALDKFKGSLDALTACRIVSQAIGAARADAEIIVKPMADGGDGTAEALVSALRGEWIVRDVTGPLPAMRRTTKYGWLPRERTAVIEMAAASGLALLEVGEHNPLRTTTFGTGELIGDASERGARKILLGVGGSATVDGGVGAAMALGWKFLDDSGQPVGLGGGELERIAKIVPPHRLRGEGWPRSERGEGEGAPTIDVLCDVDNPLCGPHGAARVFGPQKGATPEMVERLERGLCHLATLIKAQFGKDVRDIPGTGAAGGLPAGAIAFLDARLVPGINAVMEATGLEAALHGAAWVITGEGRFDEQSLRGKVVSGVAERARQQGVKVAVLAGSVSLAESVYRAAGIELALATQPSGVSLGEALAQAEELLEHQARALARRL